MSFKTYLEYYVTNISEIKKNGLKPFSGTGLFTSSNWFLGFTSKSLHQQLDIYKIYCTHDMVLTFL